MSLRGRRVEGAVAVACVLLLGGAAPLRAQGTVSGRVAITEKPGETTTDLASAVVFLVPKSGTARTTEHRVQMAINGRQFSPRVRIVTTGSTVEYPNQDPFSHNVFSTAAGASFDLGVYGSGPGKSNQFKKPGAFPVYCNIHEKMTGYVVVVATPYLAQAAADGRWSIAKVPAGKYELHFWHERGTELVKDVEVAAAGLPDVNEKLDARGFKLLAHKDKTGKDYTANGTRY